MIIWTYTNGILQTIRARFNIDHIESRGKEYVLMSQGREIGTLGKYAHFIDIKDTRKEDA